MPKWNWTKERRGPFFAKNLEMRAGEKIWRVSASLFIPTLPNRHGGGSDRGFPAVPVFLDSHVWDVRPCALGRRRPNEMLWKRTRKIDVICEKNGGKHVERWPPSPFAHNECLILCSLCLSAVHQPHKWYNRFGWTLETCGNDECCR